MYTLRSHWQKSVILNESHGLLSIVSNKHFCYIGSSNGDVYEYDIEMCKVSQIFNVCPNNTNICDLQIDANFLFIASEFGEIIIWELSLGFAIDSINDICHKTNVSNGLTQKCVGLHYESEFKLLVVIYDSCVIVYDYVMGSVKETVHFQHFIASFTFYNGSVFCGGKNAIINQTKLNSFQKTIVSSQMDKQDISNKFVTAKTDVSEIKKRLQNVSLSKRRALHEIQPTMNWKAGNREFTINFNKSFGK